MKARKDNFEHFVDSIKKSGYIDKEPILLTNSIKFELEIVNHQFLRVDTIYNRVDSIFATTIAATLIASKYKVNKKWCYEKEYSNMNLSEVENKMKYCSNHSLEYYSKCKMYNADIDLSIFTWLIGHWETFQTGDHYEYEYFK